MNLSHKRSVFASNKQNEPGAADMSPVLLAREKGIDYMCESVAMKSSICPKGPKAGPTATRQLLFGHSGSSDPDVVEPGFAHPFWT